MSHTRLSLRIPVTMPAERSLCQVVFFTLSIAKKNVGHK